MQSESFGTFHVGKTAGCTLSCCVVETAADTRRRVLQEVGERKILRVSRTRSRGGRGIAARPVVPPPKRERTSDVEEIAAKRARCVMLVDYPIYASTIMSTLQPAGLGEYPLPEESEEETPEPCNRCKHD